MNFFYSLQVPPASDLSLIAAINLLMIIGILCSIAILVTTRRQVEAKRRIEGFEFMHEVEPLSPHEPSEFYYLF